MNKLWILLFAAIALTIGLAGFIYSGVYSVAANTPHTPAVTWALTTLRDRSIKAASQNIVVPDLGDPELLIMGGPDYNEMCASCHMRPGLASTDLSIGLYPPPPSLLESRLSQDSNHAKDALAKRNYWVIKNGIKASGMPSWGDTHSDERLWAMVAFLRELPHMTELQYQILTTRVNEVEHRH